MSDAVEEQVVFEEWLVKYFKKMDLKLPSEQLEGVRQLKVRSRTLGMVPADDSGNIVQMNPDHPLIQAVHRGDPIDIGEGKVEEGTSSKAQAWFQSLSPVKRWGVMFIGIAGFLIFAVGSAVVATELTKPTPRPPEYYAAQTATVVARTPTVTLTVTATSPFLIADNATLVNAPMALDGPVDPLASALYPQGEAPWELQPTLIRPEIPPSTNLTDPISLEVGKATFILGMGQVSMGGWTPYGAEWLSGTQIRRVVAIPNTLLPANSVTVGDVIHLRFRNSAIVDYRIAGVKRVGRGQIEFMTEIYPSLVVILYNIDPAYGTVRDVIFADALTGVWREDESLLPTPTPPAPTPSGALLLISGWRGFAPLLDKPCGSLVKNIPNGTWVEVTSRVPEMACHTTWLYVREPGGEKGWVQWSALATPTPQGY